MANAVESAFSDAAQNGDVSGAILKETN